MKTKTFGLFALSIFALVFLMSAVSAVSLDPITVYTIPSSVDHAAGSFDIVFNLTNTGTSGTLDWGASTVTSGASIAFDDNDINATTTETITATVTFPETLANINGVINVTGTGMSTYETLSFSVTVTPSEIQSCNAVGNPGDLRVKSIDFTNDGLSHATFGEDDEWFPFEEIEVEIDIKNDGNYDVDDIEVSWGLYDVSAGEWAIDFDEEDEVNIKDGDTETFIVSFKIDDDLDVDLDELSDNTNNYRLYVVADGTIDDNDSPDDGEDTCAFDYEPASIIIENDFVVLDNIKIQETVQCGETVTVTADVWNIGSDDQDEVSVEVFDRGNVLGVGEIIEAGDIDAFDRQQISFTFDVPNNAEEKFYQLIFEISDEDGDVYENDFDDDLAKFIVPFKVEGSCGVGIADVTISATLESEAKAGKEMVIRATVTNNGDELKTFNINAAEFAAWADAVSQDQNTLVLNAGQSRDIFFTFDLNRDASGTQTFFIELVSDDDVTRQPVSVNIEASRPFLGITGFAVENASMWGLGLLNLILVVIIIIVAVRIARRK